MHKLVKDVLFRSKRFTTWFINRTNLINEEDRKKVFEKIYTKNIWGGEGKDNFFSGPGSHERELFKPYCEFVNCFVNEKRIHTIVDLGCGDFNVASNFANRVDRYIGIDIASNVIDFNNKKNATNTIEFRCLDGVVDKLPEGELCLIRQVLQHLSNDDIKKILEKVSIYNYVLVTEAVYNEADVRFINVDKVCGNNTRLGGRSGVYIQKPPFSINCERVLSIPYKGKKNVELVTWYIQNSK